MATTQQFETVVTLNTQQAKNEIEALQKKIDDLKKKKEETAGAEGGRGGKGRGKKRKEERSGGK